MKYLFIILGIAVSNTFFAQNGIITLKGTLRSGYYNTRAELIKSDTIIETGTSINPYIFTFDSLKPGLYSAKIYSATNMVKWYENIIVAENEVSLQNYCPDCDYIDTLTGILQLFIHNPGNTHNHYYSFNLFKADSLVQHVDYKGDDIDFAGLMPGEYELVVKQLDADFITYSKIKIRANAVVSLEIILQPEVYKRHKKGTGAVSAPFFLYGNPNMSGDVASPIAGNIKIGVINSFYFSNRRYINPGFEIGVSLDLTSISGEWDPTILPGRKRENYFGGKFTYGLVMKFTAYQFNKTTHDDLNDLHKLFLDLGVQYNFPIFFHHVSGKGTLIVKKRFIHQFKDVNAVVRIGYKNLALIAEARLFDYLLGNYPELPRYKVGIVFPIYN